LVVTVAFLFKEGRRDEQFLQVLTRHYHQKDRYSPARMHMPNLRNPRPHGFNRLEVL